MYVCTPCLCGSVWMVFHFIHSFRVSIHTKRSDLRNMLWHCRSNVQHNFLFHTHLDIVIKRQLLCVVVCFLFSCLAWFFLNSFTQCIDRSSLVIWLSIKSWFLFGQESITTKQLDAVKWPGQVVTLLWQVALWWIILLPLRKPWNSINCRGHHICPRFFALSVCFCELCFQWLEHCHTFPWFRFCWLQKVFLLLWPFLCCCYIRFCFCTIFETCLSQFFFHHLCCERVKRDSRCHLW